MHRGGGVAEEFRGGGQAGRAQRMGQRSAGAPFVRTRIGRPADARHRLLLPAHDGFGAALRAHAGRFKPAIAQRPGGIRRARGLLEQVRGERPGGLARQGLRFEFGGKRRRGLGGLDLFPKPFETRGHEPGGIFPTAFAVEGGHCASRLKVKGNRRAIRAVERKVERAVEQIAGSPKRPGLFLRQSLLLGEPGERLAFEQDHAGLAGDALREQHGDEALQFQRLGCRDIGTHTDEADRNCVGLRALSSQRGDACRRHFHPARQIPRRLGLQLRREDDAGSHRHESRFHEFVPGHVDAAEEEQRVAPEQRAEPQRLRGIECVLQRELLFSQHALQFLAFEQLNAFHL